MTWDDETWAQVWTEHEFLHLPRPLRPRSIKISHLALKRLDVSGVGMIFNKWGHIIVIRPDPIVGVYFIRHVRPVNIVPSLIIHEIHALVFGVPLALRARPCRRTSGYYALESILIDGDTRTDAVVSQSLSEFTIGIRSSP